eukprot:Opistho-2@41710
MRHFGFNVTQNGTQLGALDLHKLQLFFEVCKHLHSVGDLLAELQEFLISLLDLLVVCLVLNLQLLKVNQMQSIRKLLLLLELILAFSQFVSEFDVLQSHRNDFHFLPQLILLKTLHNLWRNGLSCSTVFGCEGHFPLERSKLLSHLLDTLLLFLELVTEFLHLRCVSLCLPLELIVQFVEGRHALNVSLLLVRHGLFALPAVIRLLLVEILCEFVLELIVDALESLSLLNLVGVHPQKRHAVHLLPRSRLRLVIVPTNAIIVLFAGLCANTILVYLTSLCISTTEIIIVEEFVIACSVVGTNRGALVVCIILITPAIR